jgi:hypothetical protein
MKRGYFKRRPSGNCPLCKTWRYSLHRDHIIPKWRGGVDELDNWQYICANCHEDKTREENSSPERRALVSQQHTGRKRPDGVGARISAALKGRSRKPLTEEHKRKLSEVSKGVPKGPFTEAHKRNLSKGRKRWWAQKRGRTANWPILMKGD